MFDVYLIEAAGQAAGLLARDGEVFRFHAAVHRFNALEARSFSGPAEAERAARDLLKAKPRRPQTGPRPALRAPAMEAAE